MEPESALLRYVSMNFSDAHNLSKIQRRSANARCASSFDLSAPNHGAKDRVGSSLRHCYGQSADADPCTKDFDDLLSKLG